MIKKLLRNLSINTLGIYLASKILTGAISFAGGYETLVLTAGAIILANWLIRPIINLLLLPINLITLGAFRWVTNLLVIYAVTRFVPQFNIQGFTFQGFTSPYLVIPVISFSALGAYVIVTVVFTFIFQFLYWLFSDEV